MPRTKKQLEDSRDQLRYAVKRFEEEVALVVMRFQNEIAKLQTDIDSLEQPAKLDEDFFWTVVVPCLQNMPDGTTSAHLGRLITARGFSLSSGNLRTAMSRWGKRGLLIAGVGSSPKWWLSAAALERVPVSKKYDNGI